MRKLVFLDFFVDGNDLWFIDYFSGGLFKFDLSDRRTRLETGLPIQNWRENYRSLYVTKGKVYMPPLFASDLLIYDIEKKQIKKVSLKNIVNEGRPNFVDIFLYGDYLYCVPMEADGIIRINTVTDQIDVYDDFLASINVARSDAKANRPRFRRGCFDEQKIYLASCRENIIVSFDLASCSSEIFHIEDSVMDGFSGCYCTREGMAATSYDCSKAVILNVNDGLQQTVPLMEKGLYSVLLGRGNQVWYISCSGNGISEIMDINSRSVDRIRIDPGEETDESLARAFPINRFMFAAKLMDDKIWIYSTKRTSLCIFDLQGNKLDEYEFTVGGMELEKLQNMRGMKLKYELKESMGIVQEDSIKNLKTFINVVTG